MATPLISCICVTRGELALPYYCFKTQSYPNLELVVVHEREEWAENPEDLAAIVLSDTRVKSVYVSKHEPLGELYNIGVRVAAGEYFIVWDSDDWSAPRRVEKQMRALTRERRMGCALTRQHVYDYREQKVYLTRSQQHWPGTILGHMDVVLQHHPYPQVDFGFDSQLCAFMRASNWLAGLDSPELLAYGVHDSNSTGSKHTQMIIDGSQLQTPEVCRAFTQRFQSAEKELFAQ